MSMTNKEKVYAYLNGDTSIEPKQLLKEMVRNNILDIHAGVLGSVMKGTADSDYLTSTLGTAAWTALTEEELDGRCYVLFRMFVGDEQARVMAKVYKRAFGEGSWYENVSFLVGRNFSNKIEFIDWIKSLAKDNPNLGFKLLKLFKS